MRSPISSASTGRRASSTRRRSHWPRRVHCRGSPDSGSNVIRAQSVESHQRRGRPTQPKSAASTHSGFVPSASVICLASAVAISTFSKMKPKRRGATSRRTSDMNSTVCKNNPPREPLWPGPSVTREKSWQGGAAEKRIRQRPTFSITSATLAGSSSFKSPRHERPGICAFATAVAARSVSQANMAAGRPTRSQTSHGAAPTPSNTDSTMTSSPVGFLWASLGLFGRRVGYPVPRGARTGPVLSLASALPVAGTVRLALLSPAAGALLGPLVLPLGAAPLVPILLLVAAAAAVVLPRSGVIPAAALGLSFGWLLLPVAALALGVGRRLGLQRRGPPFRGSWPPLEGSWCLLSGSEGWSV